jgi:hypothetical protein
MCTRDATDGIMAPRSCCYSFAEGQIVLSTTITTKCRATTRAYREDYSKKHWQSIKSHPHGVEIANNKSEWCCVICRNSLRRALAKGNGNGNGDVAAIGESKRSGPIANDAVQSQSTQMRMNDATTVTRLNADLVTAHRRINQLLIDRERHVDDKQLLRDRNKQLNALLEHNNIDKGSLSESKTRAGERMKGLAKSALVDEDQVCITHVYRLCVDVSMYF